MLDLKFDLGQKLTQLSRDVDLTLNLLIAGAAYIRFFIFY